MSKESKDVEDNLNEKGYVHPENYVNNTTSYSPYMCYDSKNYVNMSYDPYAKFSEFDQQKEEEEIDTEEEDTIGAYCPHCRGEIANILKGERICKRGHKWVVKNGKVYIVKG
jgi:hypothetical protein